MERVLAMTETIKHVTWAFDVLQYMIMICSLLQNKLAQIVAPRKSHCYNMHIQLLLIRMTDHDNIVDNIESLPVKQEFYFTQENVTLQQMDCFIMNQVA